MSLIRPTYTHHKKDIMTNNGPAYGDKQLLCSEDGNVYFTQEPSENIETRYRSIICNIHDYERYTFTFIQEYGLTLDDFKTTQFNDFGYKSIGYLDDFEFMLTAQGTIVLYHLGVPSMLGLASHISTISGIFIDSHQRLISPRHTCFSKHYSHLLTQIPIMHSFRTIPYSIQLIAQSAIITNDDKTSEDVYGQHYSPAYKIKNINSKYLERYPKLNSSMIRKIDNVNFSESYSVSPEIMWQVVFNTKQYIEELSLEMQKPSAYNTSGMPSFFIRE